MIRLYINPRIGTVRLQGLRPPAITKFYRDLLTSGGKKGGPLAANTVKHVHTVLRKALTDAVLVDELLPNNPAERAKLPRTQATEPGMIWTTAQLRAFLATAYEHDTCASLLAALDVHPRVAMRVLRHSQISVTMNVYTQVPSPETRKAPDRLNASLESESSEERLHSCGQGQIWGRDK